MSKLIIIGASYLQVPLIERANEMGYETHVFAWEEGAVGKDIASYFYPISITEKEKILEKAQRIKPAGVLSIASDLAMPTVNYIAQKLGLVSNSIECTLVTTNKALMRKRLSEANLPCPAYKCINKISEVETNNLKMPVIVKPVDRSGSRGIKKVERQVELFPAIERAFQDSLCKEVIVEEFIEGKEVSVEMISWKGEHHYLAITDKVTSGDPYYVEIEQHEPATVSEDLEKKIIKITKKCLDALEVEYGASHTELLITSKDEIYVVEVGARMGGDHIGAKLVHLSTGYDFVRGVIEVACNIKPTIHRKHDYHAGMYYFLPRKGTVKSINGLKGQWIIKQDIFVNEKDKLNVLTNSSERIGYILYQCPTKRPNFDLDKIIEISCS